MGIKEKLLKLKNKLHEDNLKEIFNHFSKEAYQEAKLEMEQQKFREEYEKAYKKYRQEQKERNERHQRQIIEIKREI